MKRKIGYISLGCAKNLVDTEVMLGLLDDHNFEISEELEDAEFIIINTCTFIEKAKQQSIDMIIEAGKYKKFGKCKGLLIAGCMSQQYGEELFSLLPEIDAMLGTGSWNRIIEAIEAVDDGKRAVFMDEMTNIYDERMPRIYTTPEYSAYIKIAEGCDNGCTFCIIPKVRGRFRSRTIESIVEEAKFLASTGVKEINLVAQDSTFYGADINDGKPLIVDLLKALVAIEDIKWVRMLYMYPKHFTDELLDYVVSEPKVCSYIDVPLQHISNNILRRMNRKDTREGIESLLKKIRSQKEHLTLRTSIIVGFPGETDEEFAELCEFVKEVRFDNLGVFTYSQEEGTGAGIMPNQIPEEIKEERYHALMAIQAKISEENNRDLEGSIHEALVESIEVDEAGNKIIMGRMENQAPDVDGNIYIENDDTLQIGDIVPVKVVQGFAYDVIGEVIKK